MSNTLSKKDLKCICGKPRHFENKAGLLLYHMRDKRKAYKFYCPECRSYGEVIK